VVPTPHGEVKIALFREGEQIRAQVTVPCGTVAVIAGKEYGEGQHEVRM
jgi:hypothetical protein